MKYYITPLMKIISLSTTDVIRTSIFEEGTPENDNDNDNIVGAPGGWLTP